MKTTITILLIGILSFNINAQTDPNPLHSTPYIEVTGIGEMEIIPDEIFISFTLKERFEGKKKMAIEEQEKELKQELQKIKFDLKNLMLADASADYLKVKWRKKDVITSKDYHIKVEKTSDLEKVFNILDKINAFDADIFKVDHSKIEDFRKEVKIMAIKAAKQKASYLLEAVNEEVGRPLYIVERETYEPNQPFRKREMSNVVTMAGNVDAAQVLPEISFRKINLKYKVFARFAIK